VHSPLSILVAYSRPDIVATSIIDAVRQEPDLRLTAEDAIELDDVSTVLSRLEVMVDCVILIGTDEEVEACSVDLLTRFRDLVVVRVAIETDVVDFARRDVGHEALFDTMRSLARSRRSGKARTADYKAVTLSYREDGSDVTWLEERPRASPGLKIAMRWIDAELERFADVWPTTGGHLNLSIESVRMLLSRDVGASAELDTAARDTSAELYSYGYVAAPQDDRLIRLVEQFKLSFVELQTLLLAAASELDAGYGRVFGYFQDNPSRVFATLGLIVAIIGDPLSVRVALTAANRLCAKRLVVGDGARLPAADAQFSIDPAVLAWLVSGTSALGADVSLSNFIRRSAWSGAALLTRPSDLSQKQFMGRLFGISKEVYQRWLLLVGDVEGWRAVVEAAAIQESLPLARIDVSAIQSLSTAEKHEITSRIARSVLLDDSVVVLDVAESSAEPGVLEAIQSLADALPGVRRPIVLLVKSADSVIAALPKRGLRELHRAPLTAPMRMSYFKQAAKSSALDLDLSDPDAASLATVFNLSLPQIERAAVLAAANSNPSDESDKRYTQLKNACRHIAAPELPKVAHRIETLFRLDDVILPPPQKRQLEEIVANVEFAGKVLDNWGLGEKLAYGRGVAALFSGPSGCGKTMAAQAIAGELGTSLYVIDLSRVMSKWIGETEKNIDMAFSEAESASAVLLFDEADGLFSKRTAATDSHARHSNIEVAYLLQRIETFSGLAILTTNLRQNLDEAFLRRLRFIVEFQKPSVDAREAIWRQCYADLSLLASNVRLDDLARRIDLPGGSIRQIALRAAFAAAADKKGKGDKIEVSHLHEAARAELVKLGMSSAALEFAERAA
jgi:hypothetical protein